MLQPLLKGENIESFVAITRNLIPKFLKNHHFLNETSNIDFVGLKNTIFSKFRPSTFELKLQKMQFLGLENPIFSRSFTFSPSLDKFLGAPMVEMKGPTLLKMS